MVLDVGDVAPDFTLKNQHGQDITLSSLRGSPVVVIFFPFAFSGICTGEFCELSENLDDLTAEGTRVLAISVDHFFANRAFADREGYAFDFLSDHWPHGEVSRAFGIFNDEVGVAERGTYVLDGDGIVRWKVEQGIGEARDLAGYRGALAALA